MCHNHKIVRFFIKIFIKIKKSYFEKIKCNEICIDIYLLTPIFHQFAKHVYLSITEEKSDDYKLTYVGIFGSYTTTDKSICKIV